MGEWQRHPGHRTRPGQTDEQDLSDVIGQLDRPEPFTGSLDDVIDLAIAQMGIRLRDEPESVPAHVLKGILAEANKAAERRAAAAESENEAPSVLDAVGKLPAEKAKELLDTEIARTESALTALREKRKELDAD